MKFPLELASIRRLKSKCSIRDCLLALYMCLLLAASFEHCPLKLKQEELFIYSILHGIIFMIINVIDTSIYGYENIQRICITV